MKTTSVLFLASLAIAVGLLSLGSASAHGGRYRGPKPPNQIKPPWAAKIPQGKGPQTTRPPGRFRPAGNRSRPCEEMRSSPWFSAQVQQRTSVSSFSYSSCSSSSSSSDITR